MSIYVTFGHPTGEAVRLGPYKYISFDDCSVYADGKGLSIAEWGWQGDDEQGWLLNHPNEGLVYTTTRVEASVKA